MNIKIFTFLFFMQIVFCLQAQFNNLFDLNTFAMFCNNTPIPLSISTRTTGDTAKITIGQQNYNPWEISNHHKFGNQVTAVALGILLRINPEHSESIYMSKLNRSNDITKDESYTVQHFVKHGTDTLFTIYLHFENPAFSFDQSVYYNIIYPDGSTDVPFPGIRLTDNNGNNPKEAGRIIHYNNIDYKLVFGTYDLQNDITDNILFSISEIKPDSKYNIAPNPSDTLNPSVINIWTYNPGFLKPVGFNDNEEDERVPLFHQGIPDNMDIIVFQEFFERDLNIRLMDSLRPRYNYQSSNKHNEPVVPVVGKEGGVRIISKFPILEEKEVSFSANGCINQDIINGAANKGVKYVKINKLGQIIHVFGTHTGVQPCDFYVMANFIKTFTIPKDDVIVLAGDFNVTLDQFTADAYNTYQDVMDTLHAVEATYQSLSWDRPYKGTCWGYNHWNAGDESEKSYIDYVLTSKNGKIPLKNNNYTQVARVNSMDKKFWGVFDLGDHNPVYGRIELPYLSVSATDTIVCSGGSFQLNAKTNIPDPVYNWYKNDTLLATSIDSFFVISNYTEHTSDYACKINYSYMPDTIINRIPFDSDSSDKKYIFRGVFESNLESKITVNNCITTGISFVKNKNIRIFPNPATVFLTIETGNQESFSAILYDQFGRLVLEKTDIRNNQLSLAGLASGIYELIITQKGTIVFQDKISILKN